MYTGMKANECETWNAHDAMRHDVQLAIVV